MFSNNEFLVPNAGQSRRNFVVVQPRNIMKVVKSEDHEQKDEEKDEKNTKYKQL